MTIKETVSVDCWEKYSASFRGVTDANHCSPLSEMPTAKESENDQRLSSIYSNQIPDHRTVAYIHTGKQNWSIRA